MRIINARNFRASFTTLDEPVMVISREKVVGVWNPTAPEADKVQVEALIAELKASHPDHEILNSHTIELTMEPTTRPMSQAERDAVLRRISKG